MSEKLPERPSLEYLRKLAKNRLVELRRSDPGAKLATALLHVAREHGFPSWRALKSQLEGRRARQLASPAVRYVPAADPARTIAFYRDVLGFEIRQAEGAAEAVM